HELAFGAPPDLPSPHGLAAAKRAAPDGVGELAFSILVHGINMGPNGKNCQRAQEAGRSDRVSGYHGPSGGATAAGQLGNFLVVRNRGTCARGLGEEIKGRVVV